MKHANYAMKAYLIPTSQAIPLAKNIQGKTNAITLLLPLLNKEQKRYFPDKEIYMRLPSAKKLSGKKVIVLHAGAPRPNDGMAELELILQILRDNKANHIEVFFTYFPYGMQDRVFLKGETNASENLIEKLVSFYHVKRIFVIDPHFGGRKWAQKYPIFDVSAVPLLLQKAEDDFGKDIVILSPDKGGKRRTSIPGFQKTRRDSFHVELFSKAMGLKGKTVAVIDDMIKTGGTMLKFYEIAKKMGAKKVIALATHGVLPSGVAKIQKTYDRLYLTNTISQSPKIATINIGGLILNTLI